MNRKAVYTLARAVMIGAGLLMVAAGIASAASTGASAVTQADTQVGHAQQATNRADRTADENQSQQDTVKNRYCSKAETGTDPNENEDLKPMAVQIGDTLRRQYCGQ